ncbi:MAG: alanine racemase [Armatimonadetes bacterium]|nr:MAG: alanine racemase [Armatimonadota bacterium]
MRPSWIEIDLDAIEHNARQIAAHIAPSQLCAVIKADAYGHGDVPVAEVATRGGAAMLAVALVEEGVRLREADVDDSIVVLSEPRLSDTARIVTHALTPTAYRMEFVERLANEAETVGNVPYPVHLKVDTGMHRVGAPVPTALKMARTIHADPRLELTGIYTHFPVADEDHAFTLRQNDEFRVFLETLAAEGIEPKLIHAANTAAAFDLPDTRYTMCRVGLGLYGMRPTLDSGPDLDLRPAMRVVSHVAYVRDLPAGARPSYGRIKELAAAGKVATVPIGYADGVPRSLSRTGAVLIRGKRYPYAGMVTMDMVIVDVGSDQIERGDEVVLLGAQGDDAIRAEEWAQLLGTINYEIVCHFGPRLPRRYVSRSHSGEAPSG